MFSDVVGALNIIQDLCPTPQFVNDKFNNPQAAFNFQNPKNTFQNTQNASSQCFGLLPASAYFAGSFSISAWIKVYSRQNSQPIFSAFETIQYNKKFDHVVFSFKAASGFLALFISKILLTYLIIIFVDL